MLLFIHTGQAAEQTDRVGSERIRKQILHARFFDDKSAVHDKHTFCKTGNNAQIVSDPNNGHAKFIAQALHGP